MGISFKMFGPSDYALKVLEKLLRSGRLSTLVAHAQTLLLDLVGDCFLVVPKVLAVVVLGVRAHVINVVDGINAYSKGS